MATGYVVPSNSAQSLDTLATALAAEANISAADVDPGDDVAPNTLVSRVKVTGTAEADINNAISAVGDCVLQPGTEVEA